MRLYHGSTVAVRKPSLRPGRPNADFGKGFYTTSVMEHPTDLQKKEKTDRNEILIEAIQYGAPLRQLSRQTGISYGVIQRINDKMKLGQ